MKVALVLDDSLDRPDGVQQYVLTLGAYLTGQGHDVHYLCSGTTRTDIPNIHSLARNAGVTFNKNTLRIPLPTSRRRIRAFLAEHRFDVVHIQSPHSPLFAARVMKEAARLGIAVVGTFHILPSGALSSLGSRILRILLWRNLRLFDRMCAVSPPAAEFARRVFGLECRVIPAMVDVSGIARAARAGAKASKGRTVAKGRTVVAFLGRLVKRKGSLELVEALSRVPASVRERMDVRIAGRGPLADEVRHRVDAAGLGDIVAMPGFVSEEDKPRFLGEADIAVFPATGGESFGIVLIEAMAAGAGVVIGGDNPGYSSVLGGHPDVTFDPKDAEAFAALLTRLVGEQGLRSTLHALQHKRVRRYDVDAVGAAVEALYRGDPPSPPPDSDAADRRAT